MAPAKLDYACSAHYFDHIDALNLTAEQQQLIKEIPDAMFRQTVRDFCVNQQFRRDYWVRGQQLLKEGKTLTTPEENLAELTAQAREFAEKRLPILEALQIA